jgi:ATP-dependent DNA helicase RecQ
MEDQVNSLQSKGINASLIISSMRYREIDIALDNARFGKTKFLYTSPERLKSTLFRERVKDMNIQLIAIDEAHCISEWGHDFRPSYRDIAEIREIHANATVIALTASATQTVQKDIIEQLQLRTPNCFQGDLYRSNLSYRVMPSQDKLNSIIHYCKDKTGQTGIIYCRTRRSVKKVAEQLRAQQLSAGIYHGGLKPEDRKYMLEKWMNGTLKIMVATNAFGMGIDKSDVRYVLHYEIPNNIEAYYQETGRVGRDGKEADAIAYWENRDLDLMRTVIKQKYPEIKRIKEIYQSVCNFLKVAIGSGDQETYDFDIRQFHSSYNISITDTYYSLKLLQLNETLNFSENSFHPTRLKFAIGNPVLYKFQVAHDRVSRLIMLLTRSYPGIFDRYISINETELCKRLNIDRKQLIEQFKFLEQYGVIDINYQSHLPKITFLSERLPEGHLKLMPSVYKDRKNNEERKLDSMINYIKHSRCRTEMICDYFDSPNHKCGKCDICLIDANEERTFRELVEMVHELLPSTSIELSKKMSINEELTQLVLHTLLLEEKITLEENRFIPV